MIFRELSIKGAYEITLNSFPDDRGFFSELFKHSTFSEQTGRTFSPQQLNLSQSKKGALRGIHFADVPVGQAKYVQVLSGKIRDYVIDLRVGSVTFGSWEAVTLESPAKSALFLPEGLGHAFLALEEETLVAYLVSSEYNPSAEHAMNPEDIDISLDYLEFVDEVFISEKDRVAPSFQDLQHSQKLPTISACDFVANPNDSH